MLSYELALKLKEAGFPQKCNCTHGEDSMCPCQEEFEAGKQEGNYYPNLSELIEECGDEFVNLTRSGSDWYCNFFSGVSEASDENDYPDDWMDLKSRGSSPEEAVANLWLALNKK